MSLRIIQQLVYSRRSVWYIINVCFGALYKGMLVLAVTKLQLCDFGIFSANFLGNFGQFGLKVVLK